MLTLRHFRAVLGVVPAAVLVACGGGNQEAAQADASRAQALAANSTTTAQSVMIDATGTPQTLAIVDTEFWKYDASAATTFFTNQQVGEPSISSTQKVSSDTTVEAATVALETGCTPVVTAPTTPLPDATELYDLHGGKNDVVGVNQCKFLDGVALVGTTYTQKATATGACTYVESSTLVTKGPNAGKYSIVRKTVTETDTYTWGYAVTPNQVSYDPRTAWALQSSTNPDGTVPVAVTALLAGESVNVSKNLGTKFSFSLLDNLGAQRISNVCVSADGGAANCLGTLAYVDRSTESGLNYAYTGNAYKGGVAAASLIDTTTSADVTALDILNGKVGPDVFAGNDNGGANGQALAAMRLGGLTFGMGAGDHVLNFTATVKDNTGSLVSNVNVSRQVHIVTPGCGSN